MSQINQEDLGKNVFRFLLNYLTRGLLAGVVIYCCWPSIQNYNYWFTWHVILCTLGYLPLMSEAIMLFAGDELWSQQMSRSQKGKVHAILLIIGTTIVTLGTIDIVYFSTEHFNTAHGITGLISNILILISIPLGFAINYAEELRNYARPVTIKFTHNTVGLFGYVIGIISLCYAYYTHWFVYYTTIESRLVALIFTIIGTAWTLNTALASGYHQIKSIFT